MTATRDDISGWFDRGVKNGEDYLIVVCDTFDHDNYPVYAKAYEFWDKFHAHDGVNMQIIDEVYNLKMNKVEQMREERARNCPPQ